MFGRLDAQRHRAHSQNNTFGPPEPTRNIDMGCHKKWYAAALPWPISSYCHEVFKHGLRQSAERMWLPTITLHMLDQQNHFHKKRLANYKFLPWSEGSPWLLPCCRSQSPPVKVRSTGNPPELAAGHGHGRQWMVVICCNWSCLTKSISCFRKLVISLTPETWTIPVQKRPNPFLTAPGAVTSRIHKGRFFRGA